MIWRMFPGLDKYSFYTGPARHLATPDPGSIVDFLHGDVSEMFFFFVGSFITVLNNRAKLNVHLVAPIPGHSQINTQGCESARL